MSFQYTVDQIRNRTKWVTRRLRWLDLTPGTELNACVKCMGLKPGESVERLCRIRATNVRREQLSKITRQEVIAEGFRSMSPAEFVSMFCNGMDCAADEVITRIAFFYLDMPDDRIFTEADHLRNVGKISGRAASMGLSCRWVRSQHCGPTGRLFHKRRLAAVDLEATTPCVIDVARLDRAARVYWHKPWSDEHFEIEGEP